MPEFKQNRGYQMKGTDLYDKVQKPNGNGFYMKKKGDTEPEKGNYRDPKGKVKPGELRSQALAREAKGNILIDKMPKMSPGQIVGPKRHAENVKQARKKYGFKGSAYSDPAGWSTDGKISKTGKYAKDAGPQATRTNKPDPRFDTPEPKIKGSTVSLPAAKTKKQKRQDKRAARKNK